MKQHRHSKTRQRLLMRFCHRETKMRQRRKGGRT